MPFLELLHIRSYSNTRGAADLGLGMVGTWDRCGTVSSNLGRWQFWLVAEVDITWGIALLVHDEGSNEDGGAGRIVVQEASTWTMHLQTLPCADSWHIFFFPF